MLELLLTTTDFFSSIFGTLRDVDSLSPELVPMIGIFSVVGAVILTRFTGSIGNLTLPINCSALFIGAMTSNWLLQNVKLPVSNAVDGPLFVSVIGMSVASFCMMWWMQGDALRR